MTSILNRRTFCRTLGQCAAAAMVPIGVSRAADAPKTVGMTLSIGNYGMQSYKVEEAVKLISRLGFDGLELSMMPEWDSAPAKLTGERRTALRGMLQDQGLALTSLMENLPPSPADTEHKKTIDRLMSAAELARDLSPKHPPLIQTVLGGGTWVDKKNLFRDRLGDWLQVAESTKTVIAIKPHRGGAMSQPSEAAWLLAQFDNSPWLGMVYDNSHYALRDLSLDETIETAFPTTVLIVVKDVVRKGDQIEFALPGESGTMDHGKVVKSFYELGYRQNVCCEVSAQLSRRAGYDAEVAAKQCYQNMSQMFEKAGIPRRKGM